MTKREPSIVDYDHRAVKAIAEMQSYIGTIENNSLLYKEENFDSRFDVIDFIDFQVFHQIDALLKKTTQPDELLVLRRRAENVKFELEEVDNKLFQRLRAMIRTGGCTGKEFRNTVNEYFDFNSRYHEPLEETGYDNLDIFINGLFPFQSVPEQTKNLEPGMVYYQKTPARIVFELVEKSEFRKEDVFFDLGAGLGQVAILFNLLTGIATVGVEFEPVFCQYARNCAIALNLSDVTFIHADARKADYSEGTIFFMFTPFKGEMLQEVLEILRKEALQRKIKIITYGPCTADVALKSWLDCVDPTDGNVYKPRIFTSL